MATAPGIPDTSAKITIGLRVEAETLDRIREMADREYRSVPAEIRRLIDEALAEDTGTAA